METRARRICVHRDGIHNYESCDEHGPGNGHPGQRHRNLSVPGCLTRPRTDPSTISVTSP